MRLSKALRNLHISNCIRHIFYVNCLQFGEEITKFVQKTNS